MSERNPYFPKIRKITVKNTWSRHKQEMPYFTYLYLPQNPQTVWYSYHPLARNVSYFLESSPGRWIWSVWGEELVLLDRQVLEFWRMIPQALPVDSIGWSTLSLSQLSPSSPVTFLCSEATNDTRPGNSVGHGSPTASHMILCFAYISAQQQRIFNILVSIFLYIRGCS